MPRTPKQVYKFGPDGEIVQEYASVNIASSTEGIIGWKLYEIIREKRSYRGFMFTFDLSTARPFIPCEPGEKLERWETDGYFNITEWAKLF